MLEDPPVINHHPYLMTHRKAHHFRLLTLVGLLSLLKLQYDQEGHIDEHVSQLTCDYLLETEHLYCKSSGIGLDVELPF